MGFFSNLFGKSRRVIEQDEVVQQEVQQEAAKVIQIDDKVIETINQIVILLNDLKTVVREEMDSQHSGTQRLGIGMINNMTRHFNEMIETRSVSQEYSEIINIMASFAAMSNRFRTLPYYDPTFQDGLTNISDKLRELEHLLKLKKSILQDEFNKLKKQQ